MYKVSENYLKSMKQESQEFSLKGTIAGLDFTEKNILDGSFSVANQCSDNSGIKIGQVYIGELNATFMGMSIDRYTLKGAEVKPQFGRKLDNGEYEYIPLGIFSISKASWTSAGIVVTAYDNMAKLDKECPDAETKGTPYQLAVMACKACKVDLGTGEDEFNKFANGQEELFLSAENDIETWRDFIAWVAQTCGCFVTADRTGKIVFRTYGAEVVDTIDPMNRFTGASFSDFETRYTGISVVNISDDSTEYYAIEPDNGLTYNLGSNPFLQSGSEDTREQTRRAVLNALQSICYVPFKVSMIGDPVYDLGDILCFAGGIADGDKKYCITKYIFHYDGEYEIQGVGDDPATADARSKVDKQLQGVRRGIGSEEIVFYQFTNAQAIQIGSGEKKNIADIRYTSLSQRIAIFQLEAILDVETLEDAGQYHDAVAKVSYILNDTEIPEYHPEETWIDGRHILHLLYYLEINQTVMQRLTVALEMTGGSVKIDQDHVHCSIYGQGLAATDRWDGTLDIREDIPTISLSKPAGILTRGIRESITAATQVPIGDIITEVIPSIIIHKPTGIIVNGITENIEIGGIET